MVVHRLQQAVVVRAEVELEFRFLSSRGVESSRHGSVVLFQVTAFLIELFAFQIHVLQRFLSHDYRAEVLVFESNPIHASCNTFAHGFSFRKVFRIIVVQFVRQRRVHVFEVETLFVLSHAVVPIHLERFGRRRQVFLHALGLDTEVHEVVVSQQFVVQVDGSTVSSRQAHGHGAVSGINRREVIV